MASFRTVAHKAEHVFDRVKFKVKDALNLFDPVIIYPYRGYGNGKKAWISGRILEKERMIHDDDQYDHTFWNNLRKIWKRYESDEIPGVKLEGELNGLKAEAVSDQEGYFTMIFEGIENASLADGWHKAHLKIVGMPYDLEYEESAVAAVRICNQKDCIGIISDVDDTIIKSNAMNAIKKLHVMLSNHAESRVAFEGVSDLYHELTADGKNPLFFVSGVHITSMICL